MKLLVLAAGMGSRFGGIKQLASAGPCGEALLEFNLFDALQAGFESVVFLIRKDLEEDFRTSILAHLPKGLPCELAYQSLTSNVPENLLSRLGASGRTKPWGTGHALLCAEAQLSGQSFGVINADDFYGKRGFIAIAGFLSGRKPGAGIGEGSGTTNFCLAGYRLGGVLPPAGSVSRAICSLRADGALAEIVEHTKVKRRGDEILSIGADGSENRLSPDALASMNLWGLDATIFPYARKLFLKFLGEEVNLQKGEFYLPTIVGSMVAGAKASVQILPVSERHFGLTNPEDLASTREALVQRTAAGDYPSPLWEGWKVKKPRPEREEA